MKSVSTYYTDLPNLKDFISGHGIEDSSSLLVQVFTAHNEYHFIKKLIEELTSLLPSAVLIGSTTDGEIMSGKVSTGKTVLSFTSFDHTTFKTCAVKHQEDGYFSGRTLAKNIINDKTKLVIAFSDGLNSNGEAFLNGINDVNSDVMVAGGLAGDNATFSQTYVFTKDTILDRGAVGVALESELLSVQNNYSFNWRRIGKPLTITKVKGNRVYQIDDRTAVDTYVHYLGEEMAKGLPAVGIEFPLIMVRNGVSVARSVLARHPDGSLSFAGNFTQGDQVQFGYGDAKDILRHSVDMIHHLEEDPYEAIFIYSCMARRHFMPDIIEVETAPLNKLVPVAGFFTYGEFFTSQKPELLNQSMTRVCLREKKVLPKKHLEPTYAKTFPSNSSINALVNLLNVTSQESMEKTIHIEAQNIFEKLFQSSPDGIVLIDENRCSQCNQKMLEIFGYSSKEEFLNAKPLRITPRKQPDGSHSILKIKEMRNLAMQNGNHQFEWVFKRKNGEHFWTDIMLTYITLNDKGTFYVVCRDISERKEMELELERQKNVLYYRANHDELTGLPNRTLFMYELKKALKVAKQDLHQLALMFIDLDRFKKVNDSLGHSVGDTMISIVGERLKLVVSKDALVARLGGDEFLVLLKNVKKHEEILLKAKKILSIIKEPITIEHYTLYSSASIGISRYPVDGKDADNLLKYADTAMYKVKEEGVGDNYRFYNKEMTDIAYEDVMMERDLREGIKSGDFEVYYQPQVNLKTGKIVGVEALVRWNHPIVGVLTPDIFIPLSEKTGLIVELDLWVMRRAMAEMSQLNQEGLSPGMLSLNVSMRQLEYPYLQKEIEQSIAMSGFEYESLELEMTETEVMKNPEKVIGILEKLHNLGISVAIDDFGTGYSSLSHLKRLPIDKLKIDRSFISDMLDDKTARTIVNTMIVLADSLNLDVVAEGVETEEQQHFLAENNCKLIQGFYYSKPVALSKLRELLRTSSQ
jgi:diguanylate cyclase (GGDEF)-like protein/PAS domain S-box-containing protein